MNTTDKKCRTCFFGYPLDGGERCECHSERPRLKGFSTVRASDYCSYWTDEKTLDRPLSFAKYCHDLKVTGSGEEERGE